MVISKARSHVKDHLKPVDVSALAAAGKKMLEDKQFEVDYFEVANADNLEPVTHWDGHTRLIVLTAAFLDGVRLIDNMLIS